MLTLYPTYSLVLSRPLARCLENDALRRRQNTDKSGLVRWGAPRPRLNVLMPPRQPDASLPVIGWREWVALPDLGVDFIKAKVDTGARSSAIHAFGLQRLTANGVDRVRFTVQPFQRRSVPSLQVEAKVHDVRSVKSSSGASDERVVILTPVSIFGTTWPIELTLARRDNMGFRMLLGRQAIRHRLLVDPGASYAGGTPGL